MEMASSAEHDEAASCGSCAPQSVSGQSAPGRWRNPIGTWHHLRIRSKRDLRRHVLFTMSFVTFVVVLVYATVVAITGDRPSLPLCVVVGWALSAFVSYFDGRAHLDNAVLVETLTNLSRLDLHTGLLQHSAIVTNAEPCIRKAERASVLVVDLDKFKQINDCHGHLYGDAVIEATADRLREVFSSSCLIGRMGGEEFVVVMTNQTDAEARHLAETFRRLMATIPVADEDHSGIATGSIGIASGPGHLGFRGLYAQADRALYVAKESGRNCTVAFEDLAPIAAEDDDIVWGEDPDLTFQAPAARTPGTSCAA